MSIAAEADGAWRRPLVPVQVGTLRESDQPLPKVQNSPAEAPDGSAVRPELRARAAGCLGLSLSLSFVPFSVAVVHEVVPPFEDVCGRFSAYGVAVDFFGWYSIMWCG